MLNGRILWKAYLNDTYMMHFRGFDNALNSCLTILYFFGIIIFPVYVYKSINSNLGNLQKKDVIEKYGVFY